MDRKKSRRRGHPGSRGLTAYINDELYDAANILRVKRNDSFFYAALKK